MFQSAEPQRVTWSHFQIQVLTGGRDTVWQIWGINVGLTTSHYVRRYWSKFRLIPLIKGKNNTVQIHDLKERLDERLNQRFWPCDFMLRLWSMKAAEASSQPEMCGWLTALSRPEERRAGSGPTFWDECTRGGRSVWLVVNAHKTLTSPMPCGYQIRVWKVTYRSKQAFITTATLTKTRVERARTKSHWNANVTIIIRIKTPQTCNQEEISCCNLLSEKSLNASRSHKWNMLLGCD